MAKQGISISALATKASCDARTIRNALQALPISEPVRFRIANALDANEDVLLNHRRLDLRQLPEPPLPALFVGRKEVTRRLDNAWRLGKCSAVQVVGDGGMGKSTVISNWLKRFNDRFDGVTQVFTWSFYSQGRHEYTTDSHQFVNAAIEHFEPYGLEQVESARRNPTAIGAIIARSFADAGGILILDGLEPLQNPPHINSGRVRDPALQQLIRTYQVSIQNPQAQALLVITTRWAIPELQQGQTFHLDGLKPQQGAQLLKRFRIEGLQTKVSVTKSTDNDGCEFRKASEEFGGHPLALSLLAALLIIKFNGDLRCRQLIKDLSVGHDHADGNYRHAKRVMLGYDKFLFPPDSDDRDIKQCRQLLGMLGLFDQPVLETEIGALIATCIPDLSCSFSSTTDSRHSLNRLSKLGLVSSQYDEIHIHPIVQEHFGRWFETNHAKGVREAHSVLFQRFASSAPKSPKTAMEISPLYRAVFHGAKAGFYEQSFELFKDRIYQSGITWQKLGLLTADLTALQNFCSDEWEPVSDLPPESRAFVLVLGGFLLRCLGRIRDATIPFRRAYVLHEGILEDLKEAANDLDNLAQCHLSLGQLIESKNTCEDAIETADLSERNPDHKVKVRVVTRSLYGHVLHHLGDLENAGQVFEQAEKIWKQEQNDAEYLCAANGFRYCSLLLRQGRNAEVLERVDVSLPWARRQKNTLAVSFDLLSSGWARLNGDDVDLTSLKSTFEEALGCMRSANMVEHLPLALFGMADIEMAIKDFSKARAFLDEAIEICQLCDLRIHLCDAHIRFARCLILTGRNKARAKKLLRDSETQANNISYRAPASDIKKLKSLLV